MGNDRFDADGTGNIYCTSQCSTWAWQILIKFSQIHALKIIIKIQGVAYFYHTVASLGDNFCSIELCVDGSGPHLLCHDSWDEGMRAEAHTGIRPYGHTPLNFAQSGNLNQDLLLAATCCWITGRVVFGRQMRPSWFSFPMIMLSSGVFRQRVVPGVYYPSD
jgi:hypothetical protein